MNPEITLTIINGKNKGQFFTFNTSQLCTIGRADDCNISIDNSSISRYHCQLNINPPMIIIQDLGSSFGTFINGNEIGANVEYSLKAGDVVSIGNINLEVKIKVVNTVTV